MTHERIRKFNTRDTYPDQKLDNDLCQVVKAGNILFLRGQVGTDFDGNLVGGLDAGLQTEQAMKNVKTLLEEAGSELGHVCKITIYLTSPSNREAVYRVVGKWLKGVFPVSTGVVVAALAKPEWLMEIDVIAVLPDKNG
jgi:enamine deaminase RidA (YjgF/YER057c/UK114 family)